MKLVIDDLQINNAVVSFLPGLPGMDKQIDVTIPSLEMKNIGNGDGSQNGAAIKDVVVKVASALASAAAKSGKVPVNVNQLVDGAVKQVLGNSVSPGTGDAISKGLEGLLSKKKKGQ